MTQNDPPGSAAARHWQAIERHFIGQGYRVRLLRPPCFVKDVNEFAQWIERAGAAAEPGAQGERAYV